MGLHARIGWVQLQIEGSGLHQLLFLAGEFGEAIGKSIGDAKVHYATTRREYFLK